MEKTLSYWITAEYLDTKQQLKSCEIKGSKEDFAELEKKLSKIDTLKSLEFPIQQNKLIIHVYLCKEILKKCAIYLTVKQPPENEDEESVAQS